LFVHLRRVLRRPGHVYREVAGPGLRWPIGSLLDLGSLLLLRSDIVREDMTISNHSIQLTGASSSCQWQFVHQRRLAPAADAERWAHNMKRLFEKRWVWFLLGMAFVPARGFVLGLFAGPDPKTAMPFTSVFEELRTECLLASRLQLLLTGQGHDGGFPAVCAQDEDGDNPSFRHAL
jgi:hypothetical protein